MDASAIVVIILLLLVAAGAYFVGRGRRSKQLQEQFGPEYQRTVTETGDRRRAERDLAERQRRHEALNIRPLDSARRERFAESWRTTQARFVDAPSEAIGEADRLVQEVMQERGYPVQDFDQRASDISVDHPGVVREYRAAHAISLENERGNASTEDLRQALVHYRSLFEELLETGEERGRAEAQR
jgi:hypothetical protein